MDAMAKGEVGAMALTTRQPLYERQAAEAAEAAAAAATAAAGMYVTEHVAGYGNGAGADGSRALFTWQQRGNAGYGFMPKSANGELMPLSVAGYTIYTSPCNDMKFKL